MAISTISSAGLASGAVGSTQIASGAVGTSQIVSSVTLTTPTIAQINSASSGTPTLFYDSAGTQIGTLCRAWVNFDGTTSPGTIRASFNISSVTRNSTGVYTANFTNVLSDANYSTVLSLADTGTSNAFYAMFYSGSTYSTSAVQFQTVNNTTRVNSNIVTVAVFR